MKFRLFVEGVSPQARSYVSLFSPVHREFGTVEG